MSPYAEALDIIYDAAEEPRIAASATCHLCLDAGVFCGYCGEVEECREDFPHEYEAKDCPACAKSLVVLR